MASLPPLAPAPASSAASSAPIKPGTRRPLHQSAAGFARAPPPSATPSAADSAPLPAGFPAHITMNVNITTRAAAPGRPVLERAQLVLDAGAPASRKRRPRRPHRRDRDRDQIRDRPQTASPSSSSDSDCGSSSGSASPSAVAVAVPAAVAIPAAAASPFEKLNTLKLLLDCGHLAPDEYQERKTQIINDMTGTSTDRKPSSSGGPSAPSSAVPRSAVRSAGRSVQPSAASAPPPLQPIMKTVVPHRPPDFSRVRVERADKLSFDVDTLEWRSTPTRVQVDLVPFAAGQLRTAYYLQELGNADNPSHESDVGVDVSDASDPRHPLHRLLVAKFSIRHAAPSSYLSDVEMQAVCAHYAALYNEHEPPLRVRYARSWLLKLRDRNDLVCSVEDFLPGSYVKYSNNHGFVGRETSTTEERERNTPQAFSHFSFVASDFRLMIVDIQGVDDRYTDPQIHSADGRGFGAGNLGTRGMEKFLASHRCNEVCRWLGLRSINEQYKPGGTAAPAYQMPFGHAIKKSTNRITEERNAFSTSVTVSEAFGDGLAPLQPPVGELQPQQQQQQQEDRSGGLRHYECASIGLKAEPMAVKAARGLGLPLKRRTGPQTARRARGGFWAALRRLLCWCLAA